MQVHVEAVNFPFNLYPEVEVELKYEDAANHLVLTNTVLLSDKSPKADWAIRLSNPGKIDYKYRITVFPASGGPIRGKWIQTINPVVLVEDLSKTSAHRAMKEQNSRIERPRDDDDRHNMT